MSEDKKKEMQKLEKVCKRLIDTCRKDYIDCVDIHTLTKFIVEKCVFCELRCVEGTIYREIEEGIGQ